MMGHKGQLFTINDIAYVLTVFQQSHPEIDIAVTPTTPTPTTPTSPLGTTPPSLDSKTYTFFCFLVDEFLIFFYLLRHGLLSVTSPIGF